MVGELVSLVEVSTAQGTARAFVGGQGPALLLVHGGWAGARLHWSTVWEALARHHRVIAPDLPGLGALDQPALPSVPAYVGWLVALLDALQVDRAVCVGNSFGGTVALSLAGRAPERCAGVVVVNGLPMPRTPLLLHLAGSTSLGQGLLRAIGRRVSYNSRVVPRAFADPAHVPPELPAMLERDGEKMLHAFARVLVAGDGPPAPAHRPLLLWGAADHLAGTSAEQTAHKLHASMPGSTLVLIPRAGHFPQLEDPERFVQELEAFLARDAAAPAS